ncbi:MAG: phosphate/phosphite/phosphonate ABC transporter substrate-binding protein [gamma proteobacterium symbiont of Taylorina sp.]|nr:phosphate/phosphite/phosphonate ABC transporter substrate-binding protein [gamma proteobacterium symbiont of Taylorina sp.]
MKQFIQNSFLLNTILLLLFCSPVHAEEQKTELVFGIHPYLPATILLERFTPLIEYLEQQTGYEIHIRVSSSYKAHVENIDHGVLDFAYLGPAVYLQLREGNNEFPLLGRLNFARKNTYRGAIIIHQNSPYQSLKDLKGRRFAFADPNSTLGTKVPQRLLLDAGLELSEFKYHSHLKNHHDVALAVLMGKYDVGAIKEEVLQLYQSRGLKVLQWSPEIPSHLFVASRNMNKMQVSEFRKLLLEVHLSPGAENILNNIKKGCVAIIPAQADEYEALRQLINVNTNDEHMH